ncbi:MAG TPA: TetR family transcriptional regulator [Chitinophagaceae bacterium]|nr:TetR family transcriptional regulator [Chitinophagaceae bacterium]
MGITERKEKQKLELRRMILEASMQLFVQEGFDNVSIRKIADKIEYSPTTIYLYFKDKNDILFHLCEEGFAMFSEQNQMLLNIQNPLLRLFKMGENYLDFGLKYPEYYDLMFIQSAPMQTIEELHCGDWKNGDRALETLTMILQECMDKNLIAKADTNILAMAIWGMVHGLVSLSLRKRLDKLVTPELERQTMQQALQWMINAIDISTR